MKNANLIMPEAPSCLGKSFEHKKDLEQRCAAHIYIAMIYRLPKKARRIVKL